MNPKSTWTLVALAAALFAFIFFYERNLHEDKGALHSRILPQLKASAVTGVTVRPAGQLEIRADRTNNTWQLTRPVTLPGDAVMIDALLLALEKLSDQTRITAGELKGRPQAEKEFGLESPQFSLIIQQGDQRNQVLVGNLSPLRDQVFLQVVGVEDILAVDANLLRLIPRVPNHWRDAALVNLKDAPFDRVIVTNGAKVIELERDATKLWRMVRPMQARADSQRMDDLLQKLEAVRATEFVSDSPKPDLDAYGFQPPDFELALAQGTNTVALLQFGKSLTNDDTQVYARRDGGNAIVLAPKETLAGWRAPHTDFRDHHLTALSPGMVDAIEVSGTEPFALRQVTNDSWRVVGTNSFAADTALVHDLLGSLTAMEVSQFVKDVVTPLDYPTYGLEPPSRQYVMKSGATNSANVATNKIVAEIIFGATQGDKVFVRRGDENSVYAVRLADFQRLPGEGWQLRDRRLWDFSENDVSKLTVVDDGKTMELIRSGTNQWALAAGSQGIINPGGVEETVHHLGSLTVSSWVERAPQDRTRYGFGENPDRITVETKQGQKWTVEFGGGSARGLPLASAVVDGQACVFEFPMTVFQLVQDYLRVSQNAP